MGCNKWISQGCEGCKKVKSCEVVKVYNLCYHLNKLNPANKK